MNCKNSVSAGFFYKKRIGICIIYNAVLCFVNIKTDRSVLGDWTRYITRAVFNSLCWFLLRYRGMVHTLRYQLRKPNSPKGGTNSDRLLGVRVGAK